MGIPVVNFTPSKGNDKHTRVNSVAPLFESGMIYAPNQEFAEEVIEECAAFPFGDHDDLLTRQLKRLCDLDRVDLYYTLMMKKEEPVYKTKKELLLIMGKAILEILQKLYGSGFLQRIMGTRTNVVKPKEFDINAPTKNVYSKDAFKDEKLIEKVDEQIMEYAPYILSNKTQENKQTF